MWPLAHQILAVATEARSLNLGRIQVSFVEYEKRHGISTEPYLDSIRHVMKGIPGAEISLTRKERAAN